MATTAPCDGMTTETHKHQPRHRGNKHEISRTWMSWLHERERSNTICGKGERIITTTLRRALRQDKKHPENPTSPANSPPESTIIQLIEKPAIPNTHTHKPLTTHRHQPHKERPPEERRQRKEPHPHHLHDYQADWILHCILSIRAAAVGLAGSTKFDVI